MTKQDIEHFIQIMKTALNEDWTPGDVEEKYGDCETLKDAVDRCMNAGRAAVEYLEELVTEDLKQMKRG